MNGTVKQDLLFKLTDPNSFEHNLRNLLLFTQLIYVQHIVPTGLAITSIVVPSKSMLSFLRVKSTIHRLKLWVKPSC